MAINSLRPKWTKLSDAFLLLLTFRIACGGDDRHDQGLQIFAICKRHSHSATVVVVVFYVVAAPAAAPLLLLLLLKIRRCLRIVDSVPRQQVVHLCKDNKLSRTTRLKMRHSMPHSNEEAPNPDSNSDLPQTQAGDDDGLWLGQNSSCPHRQRRNSLLLLLSRKTQYLH